MLYSVAAIRHRLLKVERPLIPVVTFAFVSELRALDSLALVLVTTAADAA